MADRRTDEGRSKLEVLPDEKTAGFHSLARRAGERWHSASPGTAASPDTVAASRSGMRVPQHDAT